MAEENARGRARCRKVTKSGKPCQRLVAPGAMLFCWQHADSAFGERAKAKRNQPSKWRQRLETTALVASTAVALNEITQTAVHYLLGFFAGPAVDPREKARQDLVSQFPPTFSIYLPERFVSGEQVDFITLRRIYMTGKAFAASPELVSRPQIQQLEDQFLRWYDSLSSYHKQLLIDRILDSDR
jgi:hypothetical protein